jgi:hypothetical protein
MGREAMCTLVLSSKGEEKKDRGKALLETDLILFRGKRSLKIPFSAIDRVEAKEGTLRLHFAGSVASFEL